MQLYLSAFDLDVWAKMHGSESKDSIPADYLTLLLEDLRVAPYLHDDECSSTKHPFAGATERWKNGNGLFIRRSCFFCVNDVFG